MPPRERPQAMKPMSLRVTKDRGRHERLVRLIVCAAIRSKLTGRVLCGARHMDIVMQQFMLTPKRKRAKEWKSVEQGFIDQFGKFLNRNEAWKVAESAKQIRGKAPMPGCLFSEDLY